MTNEEEKVGKIVGANGPKVEVFTLGQQEPQTERNGENLIIEIDSDNETVVESRYRPETTCQFRNVTVKKEKLLEVDNQRMVDLSLIHI